ncbi:hypothetical protein HHI36_004437, partial [Cryptolaemus montrouzieri]
ASHMLKLARNASGTYKHFEMGSRKNQRVFIERLYALQTGLTSKFADKFGSEHCELEEVQSKNVN